MGWHGTHAHTLLHTYTVKDTVMAYIVGSFHPGTPYPCLNKKKRDRVKRQKGRKGNRKTYTAGKFQGRKSWTHNMKQNVRERGGRKQFKKEDCERRKKGTVM